MGPQHCSVILSHLPNFLTPAPPSYFRKPVGCHVWMVSASPALTCRKDAAPLVPWMPSFFAPRRPGSIRDFYSLFPVSSSLKSALSSLSKNSSLHNCTDLSNFMYYSDSFLVCVSNPEVCLLRSRPRSLNLPVGIFLDSYWHFTVHIFSPNFILLCLLYLKVMILSLTLI